MRRKDVSTSLWRFKKCIPPKDRFWADPFVVYRNDKYYIFIEESSIRREKGHISLIVMDLNGNYEGPVKILERPYHISYPFIFEWDSTLFMIPETTAARRVDAFRCDSFPDQWSYHSTLLDDVNAADTTLVEWEGRWWLFTAMAVEGMWNVEELFAFHADTPLGPWLPHSANPIVSDVRSALGPGQARADEGRRGRSNP